MRSISIFLFTCLCSFAFTQTELAIKTVGEYPNASYGFEDASGNEVIPCRYSWAQDFKGDYAVVMKDKKMGLVNREGNEFLLGKYSDIQGVVSLSYYLLVKKGNEWGFLDDKLSEVAGTFYEFPDERELNLDGACYLDSNAYVCVRKNGKSGVVKIAGNSIAIPFKYENTITVNRWNRKVFGLKENGKYSLSDSAGKFFSNRQYEDYIYDWGDFYIMKKGKRCVFVNRQTFEEKESIRKEILNNEQNSQVINRLWYNGGWGFIDADGNQLTPFEYDNAEDFYGSFAVVNVKGKWGLINLKGEFVIKPKYEEMNSFYLGKGQRLSKVKLNNKYGYIDTTGAEKLKIEWDDLGFSFCDGVVEVEKNGKSGLIDESFKLILPLEYSNVVAYCFDSYKAILKDVNGKLVWGYCDNKGKVVIEPQFETESAFNSAGLAFVKKGGKFGALNKSGTVVVPFEYDEVDDKMMYKGFTKARKGGVYVTIDKEGKIVK